MERIESAAVAAHVAETLALAGPHNSSDNMLRRARELVRWQLRVIARRRRARATLDALASLDERTLKDIGVHRSEIRAVAARTIGARRVERESTSDFREAA